MANVRYCRTEDGASIAYCIFGSGPPIILPPSFISFAHGLGEAFQPLVDELSRSCTVVTYDGRGWGLSDRGHADFGLKARVVDLRAVAAAVGAERFSLIARLYGVPPAIQFAAQFPERVDRLLIFGGYADGRRYYEETEFGQMADALRDVTEPQWEFVSRTVMARGAMPGTPPEVIDQRAQQLREDWTPQTMLAFREANRATDVTGDLVNVKAPTMVITLSGGGNRASQAMAIELAGSIPGARFLNSRVSWSAFDDEILREALLFLGAPAASLSREESGKSGQSSLRTVLFTDLVGHTEMMSRLGDDRGRDVLREHERISREVLKANGGTEVKTMGDGFMASFGSVTKAVECAVALQRAFAEREGEPLSVRVGLNAGEPIEEDGDLFGATVILASRIAAKAEGGEILVADTVRGLCSGKGFLFADRGDFVAKGFEEPVRVYEVRWRNG